MTTEVDQADKKRILIVEDDVDCAEMLSMIVRRTGETATVARTAAEALESIRRDAYDLVLLDLNLPDGSGMDVVAELRIIEKKSAKHTLVMAVTGNKGSRQACIDGGIDGYLEKPYDRIKLLGVLKKLLGKTSGSKKD